MFGGVRVMLFQHVGTAKLKQGKTWLIVGPEGTLLATMRSERTALQEYNFWRRLLPGVTLKQVNIYRPTPEATEQERLRGEIHNANVEAYINSPQPPRRGRPLQRGARQATHVQAMTLWAIVNGMWALVEELEGYTHARTCDCDVCTVYGCFRSLTELLEAQIV